MPSVAGVDVSGLLGGIVGAGASDATLTRVTRGARTANMSTSGTNPTSDDYPCKGYVRSFEQSEIDGDRVRVDDRKIGLYADSLRDDDGDLLMPEAKDRVTIAEEGQPAKTYAVIAILSRGTAGAHYILHGRA